MKKDSFILHTKFYQPLSILTDEEFGKLMRMAFLYHMGEKIDPPPDLIMAWEFLKVQFNYDDKKYQEIVKKRSEAGKIGNLRRWGEKSQNSQEVANIANATFVSQNSQEVANIADNVNVNVNDNVNNKENILTDIKEKVAPTEVVATLTITEQKKIAREKREKEFYKELEPYVQMYGKEMIREFYDYWTEPNKRKTGNRKDLQKTWDTQKRLQTWERRQSQFNNRNNGTVTNAERNRQSIQAGLRAMQNLMQCGGDEVADLSQIL